MENFLVGQRVVLVSHSNLKTWNEYEDDDTTRGTIESVDKEGKFSVKWDSKWRTPNPSKYSAQELMSEVEANEILVRLEEEYEEWASPIRKRMEAAAEHLAEAEKLANAQDRHLTDMHTLVQPLLTAMSEIGWSTSSLSC